jgi:hypothetical protein
LESLPSPGGATLAEHKDRENPGSHPSTALATFFENISVTNAIISQVNTQTMHIKSIIHTQQHCYDVPKNLTYTLAGFEPGSAVPLADEMSTAPPEGSFLKNSGRRKLAPTCELAPMQRWRLDQQSCIGANFSAGTKICLKNWPQGL